MAPKIVDDVEFVQEYLYLEEEYYINNDAKSSSNKQQDDQDRGVIVIELF